jgi:hypothetical protein
VREVDATRPTSWHGRRPRSTVPARRSLTCVYSDDDPPDVFFGYRTGPHRRYELGLLRNARPLHVRVMIEAQDEVEALGARSGAVILQRLAPDRFLVVRSTGRRQPFPGFVDVLE